MSTKSVTINGIDLAYEQDGSGPPLVFFHGGNSCAMQWESLVPYLLESYTCYRLESRGHGRSGRSPDADYRFATLIEEATAFVRDITGPAVIMGQSMGGLLALGVAAARPDLVRGVVLEDSAPQLYGPASPGSARILRFFLKVGEHARTRYALDLSVVEHAHNIGTIALGNTSLAAIQPPEELIFFARHAYDTDPAWYEGVSADRFALPNEAMDALPTQVKCPVHLIYGDASAGSLVGPADVQALQVAGMNIASTHIPGAAHTITPWHCREVLADLKAFLGSIPY